jgi:hypothetical protein
MMNASADCSPCVALYHVRRGKAARQRKPAEVPRSPRPLVRLDPRCARSCFDAFLYTNRYPPRIKVRGYDSLETL